MAEMTESGLRADMVVSTEWLAQHLQDPDLVILHVGVLGREDYEDAHIPGARFVALDEIAPVRPGLGFELPTVAEAEHFFAARCRRPHARRALWGLGRLGGGPGLLDARLFRARRSTEVLDGGLRSGRRTTFR